jgi:hypothetical protein
MKKEYFAITVAGLIIFGYALDSISGPVSLAITNPFLFLDSDILSTYPLTAVSIGVKTLAIIIAGPLILSLISKKYILKSIILFVASAILVLYAIQQLATGLRITPIQWTLSFAFSSIGLLIPCIFYLLLGLLKGTKKVLGDDSDENFHL